MKLYYSKTPNPYKACAVAKYLNAPVEFVPVNLGLGEHKQPDFLAVNPNGKTPALEDGDVRLWEAHAIMAYLAQKAGSDLWPLDPLQQTEVLKWLNWDTAHFSRHAGRIWFQNYFKGVIGAGGSDEVEDAMGLFSPVRRRAERPSQRPGIPCRQPPSCHGPPKPDCRWRTILKSCAGRSS